MPNELIRAEVEKASAEYIKHKSSKISDDKAFSYMLLSVFFGVSDLDDKLDCVTDGSHDGGIDFIYFDFISMKKILSCLSVRQNI